MLKNIFIFFSIVCFLYNCSASNNNEVNNLEKNITSPEEIYIKSMEYFNQNNLVLADQEFKKLKQLFPLSNEAIQAEVMIGFIEYAKMNYEEAIYQFKKIIDKYPSHKELDYIYYMIAMSKS